jgi:hypothetical protein
MATAPLNEKQKQLILQRLLENQARFEAASQSSSGAGLAVLPEPHRVAQKLADNIPTTEVTQRPWREQALQCWSKHRVIVLGCMAGAGIWMSLYTSWQLQQHRQLLQKQESKIELQQHDFEQFKTQQLAYVDSIRHELELRMAAFRELGEDYEALKEAHQRLNSDRQQLSQAYYAQFHTTESVHYYRKKLAAYEELLHRKDDLLRGYMRRVGEIR